MTELMVGYVVDATDRTIERITYTSWGDWRDFLECREPALAYQFPWGDAVYATDPPPLDCDYVRILGGEQSFGYRLLIVGEQIADGLWQEPMCGLGALGEWLEFLD